MDDLDEAICEAIDEFAEAPIHYRAGERAAYIAKVKQRTAKADPIYQSQMTVIIAAAGRSTASESQD